MLASMGVPVVARYDAKGAYVPEAATPAAVDAELSAGRPVVIDTTGNRDIPPGHYFAVLGKTADGYIVSGSGTALKQGASIMTQEAMERAAGGWRNMIRLDAARLPQQTAPAQAEPPPTRATAPTATGAVPGEPPGPNAQIHGGAPMTGTRLAPKPGETPNWFAETRPAEGLVAGEARPEDVAARVFQIAYDKSDGDARFATLVGGLVNGEAGYVGEEDEAGATGLFQFDPRYAEVKNFRTWLDQHGITMSVNRASRIPEFSMGYYLPYIKDAYDGAVRRGVSDDTALITAMVKDKSRRGYGHNSGSSGANLMNYVNGLAEFRRKVFRHGSGRKARG
jgi:hypothetical protein